MAYLVFQFPTDISAAEAIHAVANHFAVGVSILGQPANVPQHIKQAVERIGAADSPDAGTEQSPAIAFGSLLNSAAAGNGIAASAQSSADAATSQTAHAAQTDTSQTSALASSIPALPPGATVTAPTPPANAAPSNPASVEFDSSGLAWDERIHSGNRTKTPGGEWRSRKGVDKNLIKSVELELRARYGAGNASVAHASGATVGTADTLASASLDPISKKQAALAYAKTQALRVAGPQQIDDPMLEGIMSGTVKSYSVSPGQGEWLTIYYAKFQAAYKEFMDAPNGVPGAHVASASPQTTGSAPVAPAGMASNTDVYLTAAVGTLAPVPNAPQGELDATGLPWDERINVPAKIKDANGVWLQRFDVPGETKLLVMAELRKALEGNVQASGSPNGAAGITPPVLVTAEQAVADFPKLMQWVVANQQAKRISITDASDAARDVGFVDAGGNGQLALMREHTAAFPYVVQILQAKGAI